MKKQQTAPLLEGLLISAGVPDQMGLQLGRRYTIVTLKESTMWRHYDGRGKILIGGLSRYDVRYAFDYDADSGTNGFVWNSDDGRLPSWPTTSILRLEDSDRFVSVFLSFVGYDRIRKAFQYSLSLSGYQPDDPNNLAARR